MSRARMIVFEWFTCWVGSDRLNIRAWSPRARANFLKHITVFSILLAISAPAGAAVIPEALAVHAILGEARGEGYLGMYAVACAIRNRGTLRGVYGANAVIRDADWNTRMAARAAWRLSKTGEDITLGADSWENTKAFGTPYWAVGKRPTYEYGNHRFFKIKKGRKHGINARK